MRLMFLSLFFHCYLLHYVESEAADFHEFLQTGDEVNQKRIEYYMNYTIMGVSLDLRTHQKDRITRLNSVVTTPVGNDTNTHDNSTSEPGSTTQSQLQQLQTSSTTTIHSQAYISSTLIPSPVVPTLPTSEGTSSTDVVSPYVTVYPPGFGPDSVTLNTETFVDPSVAEYAKKWLDEIASTTATTKLRIPKLFQVFAYDYSAEGIRQPIRRNQKTPQRKISNGQLKKNAFRHETRAIVRQGFTVPQITKRRHSETEAETFWHDPPTQSEEPALHRTKLTQSTVTKQRLKPGLLLGNATIGDDSNTNDEEELKKITSGSDESKKIMRMHDISAITKKIWYSDQTEVQKEMMRTTTPTSRIKFVRHTMFPSTWTTTPTTKSYNKIIEIRQDTYMIVFLIELSRLVAKKEKKAVHDVLKHTDQIIRGFLKNGNLHWFPQTLINDTKKAAKLLKNSEEIGDIQKQAANLHHILRRRSQMLSDEVNRIIEYADRLYNNDEGQRLLEALNEFAEYPNTTLSGYWLCNSLINNFLRPYRRLTRQRQQLMDSINMALKKRTTLSGCNETTDTTLESTIQTLTRKEPSSETTRTPRVTKNKRRHRSHKRKRERKRYRMHRPLPDKKEEKKLMLRRSVQPSV